MWKAITRNAAVAFIPILTIDFWESFIVENAKSIKLLRRKHMDAQITYLPIVNGKLKMPGMAKDKRFAFVVGIRV